MSEAQIATASTTQPADLQTMETETQPDAPQNDTQQDSKKLNTANLAFRIWPPTQRTRDAVIARLIETLTTPSVLSKRYGAMPTDKADSAARVIENEAFSVADAAASAEDDGIEVLQVYSKEISKRMLDTVKAHTSATGSATSTSVDDNNNGEEPAGGPNKENASSFAENEVTAVLPFLENESGLVSSQRTLIERNADFAPYMYEEDFGID